MVEITLSELENQVKWVKQDCALMRQSLAALEQERDTLRQGVRKLKLENVRQKDKMKKLQEEVNRLGGNVKDEDDEINLDYDELGRDFILVGGKRDPFDIRHEVSVRDESGQEHKTVERYIWYKMAEFFEDSEAMSKILAAASTPDAEKIAKEIKGFDQAKWNAVKFQYWIQGQTFKFEQVRWITNLLAESKKTYIAVADKDKSIGTGWRKNREEANKPIFWDGENQGGRWLMQYRKTIIPGHVWAGSEEEQTTQKKYSELRKFVWRRIDNYGKGGRGGGSGRGKGGKFQSNRGNRDSNSNGTNPSTSKQGDLAGLPPFF